MMADAICVIQCPNPYKRVEQGSVGLISRFGQFYKVRYLASSSCEPVYL
jgi:hypothetical protein